MTTLNFVLLIAGAGLIAVAVLRARGPWSRYRSLRSQQANVERYERWRGGVRDSSPSGASVAIAMARRDLSISLVLGLIGLVFVIAGFLPA